jgi:hypothetical protein
MKGLEPTTLLHGKRLIRVSVFRLLPRKRSLSRAFLPFGCVGVEPAGSRMDAVRFQDACRIRDCERRCEPCRFVAAGR